MSTISLLESQFNRLAAHPDDEKLLRQLCVDFGVRAARGPSMDIRRYRTLAAKCLISVRECADERARMKVESALFAILSAASAAVETWEIAEANKFAPRPQKEFIVCLDVDGVLARNDDQSVSYRERKPYPGVAGWVRALKEAGAKVYIQTARYMRRFEGNAQKAWRSGLFELECWLNEHEIPFDGVWMGKCGADVFVDDRAFHLDSNQPNVNERWLELLAMVRGVLLESCHSTNSPVSAALPTSSSSQ